jgi:LruC domain-containing protein
MDLSFTSNVDTHINIYDDNNNILLENFKVKSNGKSRVSDNNIKIPEDAVSNYLSQDAQQTFYHSSGVVMFDDSYPYKINIVDADYNDVVIDYDIEAKTVDDNNTNFKNEAWREEVKLVIHIRAMGGIYPRSVGVSLEGLDTKYITSVEDTMTLGNYNDAFNGGRIFPNSLSYKIDNKGNHPIVTINNLEWLRTTASHNAMYYRRSTSDDRLFNNVLNKDVTQYNTDSIKNFINDIYYNTNPGYINVGGGLFTLTVIFHYTPRPYLSASKAKEQLDNMINGVIDTNTQNFFINIYNKKNYEIHLKGYSPLESYKNRFEEDKTEGVKKGSTNYSSEEGYAWAFKSPVLTRHSWEKYPFIKAYPLYWNWVTSNGSKYPNWYEHVNNIYAVHAW